MTEKIGNLLNNINTPSDLRKLKVNELPVVCRELREFLINELSCNPGHFGASLGTVELTVSLHYVYNTPYDLLVWDVGHQAYSHKILTGRKNLFCTNRKYKGISGFPKPSESIYDAFGTGHASTSISAALGMATAASLKREKERKVIAVIGDGAMTGGLAFEGLNNAEVHNSNILIILNDNHMSIDPATGGISNYLLKISKSKPYNRLKQDVWNGLGKLNGFGPRARRLVQKTQRAMKSVLLKNSNLFESLGIRYFGPVDGHNVTYLTEVLRDLQNIPGPKILHVVTVKGKGFPQAEINQTKFHAPGKFDKITGEIINTDNPSTTPPKFQYVFGNSIVELARKNDKIVGVTPAMPSGSSLDIMMKEMPDRAFDVGIAEAHAVTFSAGMAIQGLTPFCVIYSTFLQRAYDQIIHDVAIQNLNVVFCIDRAGVVGHDGATHQGVFDIAYLRSIPNMTVSAPMDAMDMRNLMYTAQLPDKGPFSIRYPRGHINCMEWKNSFEEITVGKGRIISEGKDLAILSIGTIGQEAKKAVKNMQDKGFSVALYDMRFVKPLDKDLLTDILKKFNKIITVEDGVLQGGFGSAILEFINENHYNTDVLRLGIPDNFVEQGDQTEQMELCGIDENGISRAVEKML